MEINELFRISVPSVKNVIFKVIENKEDRCEWCCANGKTWLCNKLPDCGNYGDGTRIKYKKLNSFETRKALKEQNQTPINEY